MKKGKKIVVLLIAMILSIINIGVVKADTKNIEVTNITVKDKSGTITVVDPVLSSNEITSNIAFNKVDDFVTFELKIKNNESEKYKIESITDNNTNENITKEYSFSEEYIKTNETSTVTIKLTYKNKLINVEKINLNNLVITLNLVNEQGEGTSVVVNNPTTGDNILMYLLFLILALSGIIFIIKRTSVKGFKIGTLVVLVSILILPFATLALEKYEVKIKFTDIEIKGEFETYNITIDPKNGETLVTKAITYGDSIGELPESPSKEGYTFDKWVDSDGNAVTEDTVITGPIEIEAKYKVKEYTITYNLDGGTVTGNPEKYTIESEDITLKNPRKTGYTFTGWTGTGIDTKTTSATIQTGFTGNRSYTANYSANTDTAYKVKHKYEKLNGDYEIEEVTEYGETNKEVEAPIKSKTGFVNPSVQRVTITSDGSASVTYTYVRETYAFSITDRTYIDNTSTADGTYKYETPITIKAVERAGYDFAWSDGDTNLERTFTLENEKELTPVYTARTDTAYKVIHQKQKITLDGYEIADTQNLTGKTDSPISPAVNTYTGFTSPTVQSTTINGDGSTVVTYNYDREMYDFSTNDNENVTSSKVDGSYPYGTEITLTAKEVENKTFIKWSNNETSNPYTFTLTGNLTIEPIYQSDGYTVTYNANGGNFYDTTKLTNIVVYTEKQDQTDGKYETEDNYLNPTKTDNAFKGWYTDSDCTTGNEFDIDTVTLTGDIEVYAKWEEIFQVVFSHEGECTFNGSDGVITGDNCEYANGVNKYIDTGINLYNPTNHDEDYEIGFTIVSYDASEQEDSQSTIMNTKLEADNYPGVVFRKWRSNFTQHDLSSRKTSSLNETVTFNTNGVQDVRIYRIYNSEIDEQEIFYSINDGDKIKLNDLSQFNPEFNLSVWFGAAPLNATATEAHRYFKGTLSNMYIKVGTYGEEKNRFNVIFDTDGGSNVDRQRVKKGELATKPVYIPTKTGYSFVDWYEDSEYTTLYDFTKPITDDVTIYAKFVQDPFSLVFSHEGECTFNGKNGVLTGDNCAFANGINKFIDTGVNLYNSENHDKDYEIGFTIVSYSLDNQDSQATFMNTKYEANNYPGIVFRRRTGDTTYDLSSRKTTSANATKYFEYGTINKVKIYRIYNSEKDVQEIFYSINDEEKVLFNDLSKFNPEFDLSVWFGASPANAEATTAQRYLTGTLSDMYIKLGSYQEEESTEYTVRLNPNGGSVSPTSKKVNIGEQIGTLPTPTAPTGKSFTSWYTGLTDGVEVTSTYTPNSNITIYARYYTDVTGATVSPSSISILNGGNETITVSNVEEEYTFTSNNTNVATVDSTGKVTGTGVGTTTITITGSTSGKTRTINVTVEPSSYTVTLNANGGSVNPTSITVNNGDSVGTLPEPTPPTNKVFDGWYTELTGGVKVTSSYVPNNNITIYARYKNPTYTISFDAGEGSAVNDIEVEQGDSIGTLPTSTRNGYILEGWYEENTYETKVTSSTIPTGNVTYYAKWEELKVCADNENITRLSENTCSNNENITVGDGIVCKRAVKLHEETCSQTEGTYYCSGAGYTESGSKGTSTITYGSCGTSGTLSSGDAFTCDVNGDEKFDELTERFYYVSDYYDTSIKEFDDSTAVLIYYNNVTSGVSCNYNRYAYDSSNENWHGPRTLVSQLPTTSQWSNVELKNTTRQILTQTGTTSTSGGTLPEFDYSGYAARLLTYQEIQSACGITIGNPRTGELDSCNYVMENTKYAKSSIESYGHWLESPIAPGPYGVWHVYGVYRYVDGNSANFTIYIGARPAIEVPKSKIEYGASSAYTVTLNANGGSVNPTSITVNIGDAIGTLPTPTAPTGKSFTGWYTDLTGGIEVTSTYVPNTDIEIYARYNSTYTVSFDTDGGSTVASQTVNHGGVATRPSTDPTKTGYTFDDWYADDTYTTVFDFDTPITSDTSIYAKFIDPVATFDTGSTVNIKMKKLSNQSSYESIYSIDKKITNIQKSTNPVDISQMTDDNIVSASSSLVPIYMWFDNGTIYWWSEDNEPSLNEDSSSMFMYLNVLTNLDVSNFDTSNVTNMGSMFANCRNLSSLVLGNNFNTSKVTNMNGMFYYCYKLTTLDLSSFDTSKVTSMNSMFYYCKNLLTLNLGSNFDTSKVTSMNSMFYYCELLNSLDVSEFETSKVTSMGSMFAGCSSLTELDVSEFKTSNVTNMGGMFNNCSSLESLDLSSFDTSNVTNMSSMFENCNNLLDLDLGNIFDTTKVTNMQNMFKNCNGLTIINLGTEFNTENVTNMDEMFSKCNNLITIYVPTSFVITNVENRYRIFYNDVNLRGGQGTTYVSSGGIDYAHIDGGTSNPGYFTDIVDLNN